MTLTMEEFCRDHPNLAVSFAAKAGIHPDDRQDVANELVARAIEFDILGQWDPDHPSGASPVTFVGRFYALAVLGWRTTQIRRDRRRGGAEDEGIPVTWEDEVVDVDHARWVVVQTKKVLGESKSALGGPGGLARMVERFDVYAQEGDDPRSWVGRYAAEVGMSEAHVRKMRAAIASEVLGKSSLRQVRGVAHSVGRNGWVRPGEPPPPPEGCEWMRERAL